MSADFLKTIAQLKEDRIKAQQPYYENLKKNLLQATRPYYGVFKKAIHRPGKLSLIAEVKKASPSAGLIRADFNALAIAQLYAKHGAQAISVLTEDKYFQGKMAYLKDISHEVNIPTLMKDFIIHEFQIYEGAFHGANAVLLIVAMLDDHQLKDYIHCAHHLGLDALVEIHDQDELHRALNAGADIIGVNNRNLRTLTVDLNTALTIIPQIPKDKVIVGESGLNQRHHLQQIQECGAHAVLMGEVFMRHADIVEKMRELGVTQS